MTFDNIVRFTMIWMLLQKLLIPIENSLVMKQNILEAELNK
jgi:hypothetical protein